VNYSSDVTFNNVTGAAFNFDIELGTTLSRFRILTTAGAALFIVNNSGQYTYSQTNQVFIADTADASDNKSIYLCGGGSNTAARGAIVAPCGNEYSGFNGVLFLSSGDAASAYVDIHAATATSGTIRFRINSADRMRIDGNAVQIYNTTAPAGTPSASGFLYVESGALKYKGSSGTITTIAVA
jgi:hypothetical protein